MGEDRGLVVVLGVFCAMAAFAAAALGEAITAATSHGLAGALLP